MDHDDDQPDGHGRYGGLLLPLARRLLLRGNDRDYNCRGFATENNRLLCGRTFATRLKRDGEYEQDIFNLVLPAPEEADD